jgi:hypothetical protein
MRSIFLLLLLFLSPLASAEWRQFAQQNDGDLSMVSYYDPASLIRAQKPKISIMVIFSTPAPKFSWRATKFLWEANCFSKQIRLLASADFTQMGPDIIPMMQDPYTEWMPPDELMQRLETVFAKMVRAVHESMGTQLMCSVAA